MSIEQPWKFKRRFCINYSQAIHPRSGSFTIKDLCNKNVYTLNFSIPNATQREIQTY